MDNFGSTTRPFKVLFYYLTFQFVSLELVNGSLTLKFEYVVYLDRFIEHTLCNSRNYEFIKVRYLLNF